MLNPHTFSGEPIIAGGIYLIPEHARLVKIELRADGGMKDVIGVVLQFVGVHHIVVHGFAVCVA